MPTWSRPARASAVFASLASILFGCWIGTAASKADDKNDGGQQAAQEAWEKLQAPGLEHDRLKSIAGDFRGDYEYFAAAGSPVPAAPRSKGTIHTQLVYGGRFIEGHYAAENQGRPTTGQNMIGYDNAKKRYVGTWVNSDATRITIAEGTADAAGKVITFSTEEKEPTDGAVIGLKFVVTLIDENTYTHEAAFVPPAGGEPFTFVRITYTRVEPGKK